MADNSLDSPSFGIEDTMEGIGSQELINDLLAPETSTGNPDDIKPIIKETEDKPVKETKLKGKEIVPLEEGKEPTGQDIIHNFLGDNDSEEEDEEVVTEAPPAETEEPESTSIFTSLSRDLFKLGAFTKDEEEEDEPAINTAEEFLDRFNAEKKKGAIEVVNNFIGQFGEDYQRAFDAIYVKGVNPKDYFGVYNEVVNFAEMDLTKEENQIAVLRKTLTDQGMEPQDISDEIDQIKNYGDLENKATKYHKILVKKEAARLQQMEAQAEQMQQQKIVIRNQYIQNVQTILQEKLKAKEFDGIPLNPKLATELQDFLLVDKWKTPSGDLLTDFDRTILDLKKPENHAMKIKVALLLKILEKDPTLSTIQKSGISKKTDQLFGEVARQVQKSKTGGTPQVNNSWFK